MQIELQYRIWQEGVEIVAAIGSAHNLTIPDRIHGLPVLRIAPYAFASPEGEPPSAGYASSSLTFSQIEGPAAKSSAFTEIVLPDTIISFGEGAFLDCTHLEGVMLPYKIALLPEKAFSGCRALASITLPEGLTTLGAYTFYRCRNLRKVSLPQSLSRLENYAFYNCFGLESIQLPANLTVGLGALKNCSALKEIRVMGDAPLLDILADISQEVTLVLEGEAAEAHLVFPGYGYEYVEDYPARQFQQIVYGTGSLYRQCIGNYGIDFGRYDELFTRAKREEKETLVLQIALNRLQYPHRLGMDKKELYRSFLREKAEAAFSLVLTEGSTERLLLLAECGILTEDRLPLFAEKASRQKQIAFVSFLMDYQNKHFGRRKKNFDL